MKFFRGQAPCREQAGSAVKPLQPGVQRAGHSGRVQIRRPALGTDRQPSRLAIFTLAQLGIIPVLTHGNEIPAVHQLIAGFELQDKVVTLGALHTQHKTAFAIMRQGADYVMTAKGNQATMLEDLKMIDWDKPEVREQATLSWFPHVQRVLSGQPWGVRLYGILQHQSHNLRQAPLLLNCDFFQTLQHGRSDP